MIVWQVADSAEAVYNVDDYESFVHIQSEAALRAMATSYPYDQHENDRISLRSHSAEISQHLKEQLDERLTTAGVNVIDARISHLAYAPEIAQAMLQRQQAGAVIAARTRIVEGAVSMVEMALDQLKRRGVVELDSERRAVMVSNLLVVLCSTVPRNRWSTPARCTDDCAMSEKKAYPLRINAEILAAVQRWADDELRSVNAQIEYALRDALRRNGRLKGPAAADPETSDPTGLSIHTRPRHDRFALELQGRRLSRRILPRHDRRAETGRGTESPRCPRLGVGGCRHCPQAISACPRDPQTPTLSLGHGHEHATLAASSACSSRH